MRSRSRTRPEEGPATAQFSVEEGRVAMIMKGARSSRMLFLEKEQVLRIVDALEDLDDVQNVWFNADIADEVMELVTA